MGDVMDYSALFQEMKNQFSTIPDNEIVRCITKAQYNRSKCLALLTEMSNSYMYASERNLPPSYRRNQMDLPLNASTRPRAGQIHSPSANWTQNHAYSPVQKQPDVLTPSEFQVYQVGSIHGVENVPVISSVQQSQINSGFTHHSPVHSQVHRFPRAMHGDASQSRSSTNTVNVTNINEPYNLMLNNNNMAGPQVRKISNPYVGQSQLIPAYGHVSNTGNALSGNYGSSPAVQLHNPSHLQHSSSLSVRVQKGLEPVPEQLTRPIHVITGVSPPPGTSQPQYRSGVKIQLSNPNTPTNPPADLLPGSPQNPHHIGAYDNPVYDLPLHDLRTGAPPGSGIISQQVRRTSAPESGAMMNQSPSAVVQLPHAVSSGQNVSLSNVAVHFSHEPEYINVQPMSEEEFSYTQALLLHQKTRRDKMAAEVEEAMRRREALRSQVNQLEADCLRKQCKDEQVGLPIFDLSNLRKENTELRILTQCMIKKIDIEGEYALGVIDDTFYDGFEHPRHSSIPIGPAVSESPPHHPAEPPNDRDDDDGCGPPWDCSACTYTNHPLLNQCEVCSMPRENHPPASQGRF